MVLLIPILPTFSSRNAASLSTFNTSPACASFASRSWRKTGGDGRVDVEKLSNWSNVDQNLRVIMNLGIL